MHSGQASSSWPRRVRCVSLVAAALGVASPAVALGPESPEVRELINGGLKALSAMPSDAQLGANCLSALAFIKDGQLRHERIDLAVSACARVASDQDKFQKLDNYSFGLALILLCEDRAEDHEDLIRVYLKEMLRRQKPHGGWGYDYSKDGDTSQTQYLALGIWEAHVNGYTLPADTVRGLVNWLIRTQAPDGAYGYQGQLSVGDSLVEQSKKSATMGAAALGSLMIAADVCGKLRATKAQVAAEESGEDNTPLDELPPGVKRAGFEKKKRGRARDVSAGVSWKKAFETLATGDRWMEANLEVPIKRFPIYCLYAIERYKSFQEFRTGKTDPDPAWYREGFEYLKERQRDGGKWRGGCGFEADTAFAVLFLLRSTQRSIRERIGEGTLVSGRGLPKNLAGARFAGGRVIADLPATDVGGLLDLVEEADADRLDALAEDPGAIELDKVGKDDVWRLKQVLRTGDPAARYVAATTLGRLSDLDHVPDLLYAMTDPDRRVVLAARDSLRAISRRSRGYDMPDDFDEDSRYGAIESWKRWYLGIRPGAPVE